jgi:hypothetical protein
MIVVGTTIPFWAMDNPEHCEAWLAHAEAMQADQDVIHFAALEHDARGPEVFCDLRQRLKELGGASWTFSLDTGDTSISQGNRDKRIVMGHALMQDFAMESGASHLLFVGADSTPPPDALPKLLEVDWPIVGGVIRAYNLTGPLVTHHPLTGVAFPFEVREHLATSSFVLLDRALFSRVRARWDLVAGLTDDPCLHHDALDLGFQTLIRRDCVARHYPEQVVAVERRGHDMSYVGAEAISAAQSTPSVR